MDLRTSELLEKYQVNEELKGLKRRTVYYKLRSLKNFFRFTEISPLMITTADIKIYLEHISKKDLSPMAYGKIISHINGFFEFLLDEGTVLLNPAVSIERPKQETAGKRNTFSEDEIRRILHAVPNTILGRRDRAVIDLLYSTGMRVGELSALDIQDLNIKEREVYILFGKGGRERIVPVGEEALRSLEAYLDERFFRKGDSRRDALFLGLGGGRFRTKDIAEMIRRYKLKARVSSCGVTHALRHSCASHMLKNGAPVEMIRRILGHEYLSTTERYTYVSDEDLKEAHRRSFHERPGI